MTGATPAVEASDAIRETQDGVLLLDVREEWEWDRGHAPQAVSIPMSQLDERISEIPDDRRVLVVCHSGVRSERVTEALLRAGYDAVNVAGGMVAWQSAGGELVAPDGADPRV